MNFSKTLIKSYKKNANYSLALVSRIAAVLMAIVMLFAYLKIFKLAEFIYPVMIISIAIMMLPTIFYNVLHKDNTFLKYCFLTMLVFMSGLLYAILSYHVIIMLVFPVVTSCLYCEKRCTLYTAILSYPVIAVSHLLAFKFKLVPDEPLVTLHGVVAYGIVPRLLEFTIIAVIGYTVTNKTQTLIRRLAEQNDELYENQESVIDSLSEMIEAQSQETGQHVKRVCEYTKILCRALGMDENETWMVGTAAMMHDVGKIMIPSEIIEKPGKLTPEEFEIMKRHVVYGKRMLEHAKGELLHISSVIAYEHHEKYNGNGYLHMKGEEISIYARCVAIADVFDALVSWRPYKKPWPVEDAKAEILSQRGEHFDPHLVDLFEEHFDEFLEVFNKYPDAAEVKSVARTGEDLLLSKPL